MKMFSFPSAEKDKKRIMHFDKKYVMTKKLTTSAVPTLNLSVAASIKIEQQDTRIQIKEEEEECKLDCTRGVDTKSGIVAYMEYTALPGPSREMAWNDLDRLSL